MPDSNPIYETISDDGNGSEIPICISIPLKKTFKKDAEVFDWGRGLVSISSRSPKTRVRKRKEADAERWLLMEFPVKIFFETLRQDCEVASAKKPNYALAEPLRGEASKS